MDAWDLVMRGLSHYWRVTRQDNVVAQTLLEKAIAIDPNYGQALGVLATSYTFSFHMGWADRATAVPIAERAALAAIRADSEDLWAHHARFEEADQAVRRALPLSPRDPFSAIFTGIAAYSQFVARNYDEAMRLAREAIRQRSDFSGGYRMLAAAAGMAGHTEAAAAALQELRRAQPNISLAWIANEMPIMQGTELEHYLEAFRRAGLK
jgi:tetratricopeptide (TPR) repeat protein